RPHTAAIVNRHLFPESLLLMDPEPPHLYLLSLHDALPIFDFLGINYYTRGVMRHAPAVAPLRAERVPQRTRIITETGWEVHPESDRKSTRLNSSHVKSSYAVFCLKKKKRRRRRSGRERLST